MTAVTVELENTLRQLDVASASSLEQVVWDLLRLAKQQPSAVRTSGAAAGGYPRGHFERLVGSWADLDFELPRDHPPEASPEWS